MTLANWAVLAACLLPIACAGIAKSKGFGRSPAKGGYDNNNPREWLSKQTGFQQRANAAQANGFEALPLFIAAVVLAQQAQGPQDTIDLLAWVFVGLRVLYIVIYLMNFGYLRSAVWMAGMATSIAILLQAR